MSNPDLDIDTQPILVCPSCNEHIIIEKINCGIFRHGVLIKTGIQINPHASKELCEFYKENNLIYGCGKPFQIILQNETFTLKLCDYI